MSSEPILLTLLTFSVKASIVARGSIADMSPMLLASGLSGSERSISRYFAFLPATWRYIFLSTRITSLVVPVP